MAFRAEHYDRIVFDCDGVILDSNAIKSRAFHALALPYGEAEARRLLEHHQRHGGVTRHDKLAWFVDEVLGVEASARGGRVEELLAGFARICRAELDACATIPGVRAFLETLPAAGVRACVVSGGLQSEVRDVLAHKDLGRHFDRILGGPERKEAHLQRLRDEGWLDGRAAYFGDARLDMELACRFDLDFVFVAGASEWREADEEWRGERIEDFRELLGSCAARDASGAARGADDPGRADRP